MTPLFRSEWLKLRTTRTTIAMVLALLLLVVVAVAGIVGATPEEELFQQDWAGVLADQAGLATIFALLLGILLMSGEYRHGTITPTFLVSPRRGRVLVAKVVVAAVVGVVLAVVAVAVAYAIGVPWLDARGVDVETGDLARNSVGLLVSAAFWGAWGVGLGALIRNQVLAVVLSLVWLLLAEPLVGLLLDAVGADGVARYFPVQAVGALIGGSEVDIPLPRLVAGLVALAYVAGTAALAYVVTTKRDIT